MAAEKRTNKNVSKTNGWTRCAAIFFHFGWERMKTEQKNYKLQLCMHLYSTHSTFAITHKHICGHTTIKIDRYIWIFFGNEKKRWNREKSITKNCNRKSNFILRKPITKMLSFILCDCVCGWVCVEREASKTIKSYAVLHHFFHIHLTLRVRQWKTSGQLMKTCSISFHFLFLFSFSP